MVVRKQLKINIVGLLTFTMAELNVEVFHLQMQLEEQNQRVKFLEEKKSELEEQLKKSKEFEQRLVNYLIIAANQQEQLEEELKDLKLLFLQMDIKKRKKEQEVNLAIDQINESLQNLSI